MTVSIITPCYNGAKYIERTMRSVKSQCFVDWEQIVVDDGSTDDSASIVSSFIIDESRVRLIKQPNGGVCSARNAGFAASSKESEYLLFLDADDCLDTAMLGVMAEYLNQHPEVGCVYCDFRRIDEDDKVVSQEQELHLAYCRWTKTNTRICKIPTHTPGTPFHSFFAWNGVIPSVCLLRRSVYERTPQWDETFGQPFEDTDLFLQMALRSRMHYLPRPLVSYRIHATQSTRNHKKLWAQERKLYSKWLTDESLSLENKTRVRQAWHFRERVLMPYLCFIWGGESLKRHAVPTAVTHYYRGVRHLCTYILANFRLAKVTAEAN